jgi:SAM-dependent methyltransferase
MVQETIMALDETKLNAFVGDFVRDFGATLHAATVVLGDRLGLYKALSARPMTPEELADDTETDARYIREWLSAQAASGYVHYEPSTGRFSLTEEQAFTLADESSPAFLPGAFDFAINQFKCIPKIESVFRTGLGLGWHEHDTSLFRGTERFFRTSYTAHLVSEWIPALDGVQAKLEAGARVADVGCGHGASTIILAQAFPNSRFVGYDYHPASIEVAARAAEAAGVQDRVRFEVASAAEYSGVDYDLVAMFDCLHDMGDPVEAATHVRNSLKGDGTYMIVEPYAADLLEDNLTPVGRVYYSASTFICTPASRSQKGAMCLGAQAGEARIRDVAAKAGFTRFRRATQTPFNIVYEVRP